MTPDFAALVQLFQFEGVFLQARPYGSGHINDTYAARFRKPDGTPHRYLLQRINHEVFKDPEQLMQNVEGVTGHLRDKILARGGNPLRETLTLVPTVQGSSWCRAQDGNCWRAFVFIEGARTYEVVDSPDQAYQAARAFGAFQRLLADFPAERLHRTIPGFHDTRQRFEALLVAVQHDAANRAHVARPEIAFAERRFEDTCVLGDLMEEGKLPERVAHNDTKFNNVMIDDETGKGVCVIDLDTVMPGLSLFDFGDAVRSGANSALEDERDLSKVKIDLQLFDRFARGYLDAARSFLTLRETETLAFSARLMTLESGLRFLTDYLEGDVYFKVHRKDHNLDRCRTQFSLVRDMEANFAQMVRIVDRYR